MEARRTIGTSGPNKSCGSSVDAAIGELAGRQRGRVAYRQLRALGMSRSSITLRVERGRLIPVTRGVYAVGHTHASREAGWVEALLRIGDDAVLSHAAAGAHLGFRPSAASLVDVTCPRRVAAPDGIRLHTHSLPADEVIDHEGIATTTVSRTLLDLAPLLTPAQLEHAANVAEDQRRDFTPSLPALLDRYPRRRGSARLRFLVEQLRAGPVTLRSPHEVALLDFVYARDLPKPLFNYWVACGDERYELDAAWPEVSLAVEVDTPKHHGDWRAQERDRDRDRALRVAGWTVIRVTPRMLARTPAALAADLKALIYTASTSRRRSSVGRALHS
jgi:very-short-patch-repair endonuclease